MNNVVLITGSGSGIGRAIALRFAKHGNPVVVNDIARETGEQVVSEIERNGGKGIFILADVSDVTQVKKMFGETKEKFGRVDVLINNAGVPGTFSLIADMPDETWHKTMSVHLNGTFYCMREAARMMILSGWGRIINIASIAGLMGTVGSGEYAAAKAGIISLTKTAAKELGPYNITVNAIAPGMVGTPTNLKLRDKGSPFIETAEKGIPTGRMTTPEEIAELLLFICSSTLSNINGQVICVDGGAEISISMDSFMLDFLTGKSSILKEKEHSK
ncbi:MAG: SDR family oxidoreductase [Deltaproteobacteria bacterium]|nr:MAG: SDR family oxidoreductase [Deltaproteobacteria bacterium]